MSAVSKTTVLILLILTVLVSILGTITILQKTTMPEKLPEQESQGTANIYLEIRKPAKALEIFPSQEDVMFEPNLEKTIKIKIIKELGSELTVFLYAEGPLEEYISFSETPVHLSAQEESKLVSYAIKMPAIMENQGITETNIVARALPKKAAGTTTIGASIVVVSKLRLIVPYSGKYAEVKLAVPSFKQNQEANFAVEIKNLGTEDIISAQAVIDIYDPLNNKLGTAKSTTYTIRTKKKMLIEIPWLAALQLGSYRAVLTLIYDEKNAYDEKTFNIL